MNIHNSAFNGLLDENKKLRMLIDDLVNNGMDNDIVTRLEELEDEGA